MFTNDSKERLVWNAMPDIFTNINAPKCFNSRKRVSRGNVIYIISYVTNIFIINKYFLEFIISKLPEKRQKLISDSNSDHINLMSSSRIINIDNENTINIPSEIGLLNTNNKHYYIG